MLQRGFNMKAILFIIILLLIGIAVLGFYRGWFTFTSSSDNAEDSIKATITVDEAKIKEDKEKLLKLGQQQDQQEKETNQATQPTE